MVSNFLTVLNSMTRFRWMVLLIFLSLGALVFENAEAQVSCKKTHRMARSTDGSSGPKPRIIVISGTNRDGSMTLKVSKQVAEIFEAKGAQVELLDIAQVPPSTYSGANYGQTPKTFQKKYDQKIQDADAILVVFPEYNGTYPGMLGAFFNYIQASMTGKPTGMIGVSAGILGGQKGAEHLSSMFRHRRADVIGEAQVNMPQIEKTMIDGRITDPSILTRIQNAADALISRVSQTYELKNKMNQFLDVALQTPQNLDFTFNSGLSIYGKLTEVLRDPSGQPIFLKWTGPTEIRNSRKQVLEGQSAAQHSGGFSTPLGKIKLGKSSRALSEIKSMEDLQALGLIQGQQNTIQFESGIVLSAALERTQFSEMGELQVLIFSNATMTYKGRTLYLPDWGLLDMPVGETVSNIQL